MKRILICMLLAAIIAMPCLAEENGSAADDFLKNLSATWDSLVRLGEETANNVGSWLENDLPRWISNDLPNWLENDLPNWSKSAAEAIRNWAKDADKWSQEAAANLQAFVDRNGPAVETWLNQAGEDVQKAWETLTNPQSHTEAEVAQAYDTVMDTLQEAQLANPWTDLTQDEWQQKSGVVFGLPEGANVTAWRWLESDKLAEAQFTLDGDEFCARMKPETLESGQLDNISGMFFEWEHEEPVTVGQCHGTLGMAQTGSEDWVELCLWYDAAQGRMYSLSVYTTDPDGLDLEAVARMVYAPTQEQ